MNLTRVVFYILCGSAMSGFAQPVFTRQPLNQSVSMGANVTNSPLAGSVNPITYQWLKDGVELAGCTTSKLILTNVQVIHAGQYQLRATDSEGSVLSQPVQLTVDPTFTKVTRGPVVQDLHQSVGCVFGDVDGDGFPDLFIVNLWSRNVLYLNNGDGTFRSATNSIFAKESVNLNLASHAALMADIDNDGRLDLYVSNMNQTNFLYRNLGAGQFERLSIQKAGDAIKYADRSVSAAGADLDRDGFVDLVVATGGLSNPQHDRIYRNRGDAGFVLTNAVPTEDVLLSFTATVADYDGDMNPDLLITHYGNTTNSLFRSNDDGTFARVASPLTAERNDSTGAAWGDYLNTGYPSVFITHWHQGGASAKNSLFRNLGNGSFEKVTVGEMVNDSVPFGYFGCSWVDYDNDGWLDLFVVPYNDQTSNRRGLYHNNGDGTFTKVTEGSVVNDIAPGVACAWADIDGNGFPDLVIANGGLVGPAYNSLYLNNGNSNAWLKVRLTGTLSNRSAIGAKVRVTAVIKGVETRQLREITAGSGEESQDTLDAMFGLGDAGIVKTIRIEWPSGVIQELQQQPVRTTLEIVEPILLRPEVKGTGNVELKLPGRTARPLRVEASSDLVQWATLGTATPDFDVLRIADPNAAVAQCRFYRVRVP